MNSQQAPAEASVGGGWNGALEFWVMAISEGCWITAYWYSQEYTYYLSGRIREKDVHQPDSSSSESNMLYFQHAIDHRSPIHTVSRLLFQLRLSNYTTQNMNLLC